MNKKNNELAKTIEQFKVQLKHYEIRKAGTVGKEVFVFQVNEASALKNVKGKTQICRPVEASLFTKTVVNDILDSAKFNDINGNPFVPVGPVLGEVYFDGLIGEVNDCIKIIEQTILSLNGNHELSPKKPG